MDTKPGVQILTGNQVLTGNQAAALGFALAEPDVFGGYPITPSTEVTEEVAAMAARGDISTIYRNTDSELASMALGIGVSTAGGRYGTATSSQGLSLMCELLHWATTAQLPLVIANTNRSLGAPWSIHPDQTDSLLFRDMFMPQLYCRTVQEVLDMILWGYRLAEDLRVSLPVLVCFDGFMLSHTSEAVQVPTLEQVRKFLPKRAPKQDFTLEYRDKPMSLNSPVAWSEQMNRKRQLVAAMKAAGLVIKEIARDFKNIMGRNYGEGCLSLGGRLDSLVAFVSMGAICGTIHEAVGDRAKIISIRSFRPFPASELRNAIGHVSKIIVIDRSILPNGEGVIAEELRSNAGSCGYEGADIMSFVGGFGGENMSEQDFRKILAWVDQEPGPYKKTYWTGGAHEA